MRAVQDFSQEVRAMKKRLFYLVVTILIAVAGVFAKQAPAATWTGASGATNSRYACSPPFLSLAAKPNIHFVLDITGSMKSHPYLDSDNTYDTTRGYWGYFKEDMYYRYDYVANNYWQENSACTNTDLIGNGECISGKLLNYVTSNKYDIMRKILTGGKVWASDSTVLEHETNSVGTGVTNAGIVDNEATTSCRYDNAAAAGKLTVSSADSALNVNILSSSTSNKVKVAVTTSGSPLKATFTYSAGAKFTTKYSDGTTIPVGAIIFTSGFLNAANNGYWELISISTTAVVVKKAQVFSGTLAVTESTARASVLISTTTVPAGLSCKILVKTVDVLADVNATTGTFTRTDTGSFLADGWKVGMEFDVNGYFDTDNNKTRKISAVSDKVLTVTDKAGMVTRIATLPLKRFTQRLTAYTRVKSTTAATDFTGLIQSLYVAPGHDDNKIDLELSFYDTGGGVDYTGGSTTNNTVKNQPLANYINAINLSYSSGGTNTGPALIEAEKFFKQAALASTTSKPSTGTLAIDKGNGASDPYYDLTLAGTSLAAYCRKAYVILVSDGEWNNGADPVGPAYNMHRRDAGFDLRPETAMTGEQSVTTYTVYAFGNQAGGRNALIATAIYGGFEDSDKNTLPYPFTSAPASTYPTSTNLKIGGTTFTDSTDVAGTSTYFLDDTSNAKTFPLDQCDPGRDADPDNGISARAASWNASCAEWDKSPGPTDDLPNQRHTGLPYNYFEATDGAELATAITSAVNDILQRTSSSTAASILGNNDNAGASLVQALFYVEKQFDSTIKASWIGEIQSFWYYLDPRLNNITIREDTVNPLQLNLSEDQVIEFSFDKTYTKVNRFLDATGDGIKDTVLPASTIEVEDVKTLWRGGKSLWNRAASDRKIYTTHPTSTPPSLIEFNTTASTVTLLQPYLDVSSSGTAVPSAADVINYVRGTDVSTAYRSRQINLLGTTKTWKLGDIINSTPKIASEVQINFYDKPPSTGYSDSTYYTYAKSKDYLSRGTVFVGANDGMLHAFKTGSNNLGTAPIVAEIKNADGSVAADLGKEKWAFIPKNVLPYLQYQMLPSYQHMYLVDGTPQLVDAAIGMTNPTDSSGNGITSPCTLTTPSSYYLCPLRTSLNSSGQLDYSTATAGKGTSWRTVLIGSMGMGGATSNSCTSRTECVQTPLNSLGYSSFFALDVTTPLTETETDYPKLLWEFSDPRLGFSTVSPVVLRMKDTNDSTVMHRNGRWVVVLASGPTGPIDAATLSFMGKSDKPLTIFVVDLKTGELLRSFNNKACSNALNSFDTSCSSRHTVVASMPDNAFGGSLSNSHIDVDRWNPTLGGAYSDDAVYIGYTRNTTGTPTLWDKGGVLRLFTKNSQDPSTWAVSTVIDGIGPVTSSVSKLGDQTNKVLWLFFGTGRYFTKGDDPTNVQTIFGIKEPCFGHNRTDFTFDTSCTTTVAGSSSGTSGASGTGLVNQTSSINAVTASNSGWFINLPGASSTAGTFPKRVITDTASSINGVLTFVTFTPSTDVCTYGGTTSVWSMKYDTGGAVTKLKGQILVQLSTGAFQQVDVSTAFTQSLGRETAQYDGVPPKNEPAMTTNAGQQPTKRILHIQER